tara:strand:- start:6884 stop:7642 length:759 start_codon:yes stop_codon:yes gene_type:complete
MAINVNTVYQTVLLILNKEQRGYMTPQEFNNIGNQVQLEIFEKYFEDLNQQVRVPQADTDYSDRVTNLDEKISIFKTFGNAAYDSTSTPATPYFTLPTTDVYGNTITFYRLGTVIYNDEVELQRLQRGDFYYINKSQLTKPSTSWPVYLYENNKLFIKPTDIISKITVDFIRKPENVIWGFDVGGLGQYIWNEVPFNASSQPTGSVNFNLHESEQTEVILRILMYAGIIIRDPQIIQAAAQQVQMDEINKKS